MVSFSFLLAICYSLFTPHVLPPTPFLLLIAAYYSLLSIHYLQVGATVVKVHYEDSPPYYTISIDGTERSTVRERLTPICSSCPTADSSSYAGMRDVGGAATAAVCEVGCDHTGVISMGSAAAASPGARAVDGQATRKASFDATDPR